MYCCCLMSFRAKTTDFPKKTRSVYGKATKLRGRKQLILTGRYSLHTATCWYENSSMGSGIE
ncbi:hypothetical protein N7497_003800 [Penicillium chrysogenum]|nr:hypothetical protein N7497_003800 [Penicillium chrysogenum]